MDENKTIAESVSICLESFVNCLGKTTSLHPREQSLVEDQFGRFSAWTANAGALAPERASMDHRLREALEAHSIVVGLLGAFNERIEVCMLHLLFALLTTFSFQTSTIRFLYFFTLRYSRITFPYYMAGKNKEFEKLITFDRNANAEQALRFLTPFHPNPQRFTKPGKVMKNRDLRVLCKTLLATLVCSINCQTGFEKLAKLKI
jgi:hypothetical protein